ncbi:MAG: acyltransferase [Pseudomonadota bacterium]
MSDRLAVIFYYLTRIQARLTLRFWCWVNSAYLKRCSKSCGSVGIYGRGRFINVHGLVIGDNVHVNFGAHWVCDGGLSIGDNVHFGPNCTIYTRNHNTGGTALPYDAENLPRPVTISRNVWIGVNVTILPGARIGEGAIIGAGAVVHGEVPALAIYGAAAPVQIGQRDQEHYAAIDAKGHYGGAGGQLVIRSRSRTDAPE